MEACGASSGSVLGSKRTKSLKHPTHVSHAASVYVDYDAIKEAFCIIRAAMC